MFFIIPIFIEIVFVVIFVSVIVTIVKKAKSIKLDEKVEEDSFKNTISNANDSESFGNSLSSEPVEIYCSYCGSKFSKAKKKCPSCGASVQKRK